MSDNTSRTARLRQLLRRRSDGGLGAPIGESGQASPLETVEEKRPPKRVCPRLPDWVFTLSGSELQKMLDYSGNDLGSGANRGARRPIPVADTIPPALTVTDYLAHRQRSVAIRLIMDCAENKPGSVLEFVQRCDADELRRVWAGTVGGEALIATATAGPIPVLALLAAELLDRAHRWQDLGELGRAAESVGYRANQLFRDYVHADEMDARKAAWGREAHHRC
ncbi:hypothetical protein AB0L82_42395 [Nocardia sp. NPDC052001]|uniref:hypothetical protein n=1 Tax=Nocardia sp. NPDC052001 TaxID=3154853 RepID=UPI003441D640